ncbi:MAG: hypothetical protein ACTSYZ_10525 [Candidatus Helarchaeota archaeon]
MDIMKKRALIWMIMFIISITGSLILDYIFHSSYLDIFSTISGIIILVIGFLLLWVSGRTLKNFGISSEEKSLEKLIN